MTAASAVPVPASHLDAARDAEAATRAANSLYALQFHDKRTWHLIALGLWAAHRLRLARFRKR